MRLYAPVAAWTCGASARDWRRAAACRRDGAGVLRLGTEFMPPLEEGSLFYMPTTMPGISITEAGGSFR